MMPLVRKSSRHLWLFFAFVATIPSTQFSKAVNHRNRNQNNSSNKLVPAQRVSNPEDNDKHEIDPIGIHVSSNPLLDISGLSEASPFDVEDGESLELFPKSLNDFYKGVWFAENQSDTPVNFKRRSGHVVFQIITRAHTHEIKHFPMQEVPMLSNVEIPSEVSSVQFAEIDVLQVDMVLRDGQYSSSRDIHAFLKGIFFRETGEVKLWSLCDAGSPACKVLMADNAGKQEYLNGTVQSTNEVSVSEMVMQDSGDSSRRPSPRGGGAGEGGRCLFRAQFWVRAKDPVVGDAEDNDVEGRAAPLALALVGNISSPNCNLQLAFNASSMNLEAYFNKAMHYTLMVTAAAFVQVLLLVKQVEYSTTRNAAARVSLLTIGQQAVMDSYLCLAHLTMGIVVEALFNAFATAAFFKFMIFSIFEMRFLLIIWKARRPHAFQEGWERMRRELSLLYSRFYGCLLAGIVVIFQLQKQIAVLLVIFYSFWIPQIVHSAHHDHRRPLLIKYILGVSATRLLIPLYAFACPQNFLHSEPNYPLAVGLVVFVTAQVAVLLLQHWRGPRFFLPRNLRGDKYDYYRRIPLQPPGEGLDCAICMMPVSGADTAAGTSSARLVTPCDHLFHRECLRQWMDIKMECPVCRRALPDLEDDG